MNKKYLLPAVLVLSLVLTLTAAAGSYFARSFSLFASASIIFTAGLYAFMKFAAHFKTGDREFAKALARLVIFIVPALFFISVLIAVKSAASFSKPFGADAGLTYLFSGISCAGLLICFKISVNNYKNTALTFLAAAFCMALVILQIALQSFEFYLSLFFAVVAAAGCVMLAAKSLKRIKAGN
ncbi:hypothetical protein [Endomicrobium proavitum]|uniref:Uncharacterized protein n=1 Tax=Endomicrobium proavitum TaxID=1408281 RepID=A0A0G3WID3_9BACT|nr:hypothetical protein [Endomicrobium proavitum]AKL98441.1 membrane protein of unknown function [Endomicrobium proavitum]